MAYCRNCYKELGFGEIVCTGCGKKIDTPLFSLPDETIRQNENTPINTDVPKNVAPDAKKTSVEKVKCKNCGTEYDSSKSSCPKCFSKESETIYKGTVSQAVSKADSNTKMGFNSKEDRAKAVGVLSVIFAIVFLIYVIKHIQFSNSVDEYRKEIHDNKTATTTAITTNYIPKTTTKSTTTPSTTTAKSNYSISNDSSQSLNESARILYILFSTAVSTIKADDYIFSEIIDISNPGEFESFAKAAKENGVKDGYVYFLHIRFDGKDVTSGILYSKALDSTQVGMYPKGFEERWGDTLKGQTLSQIKYVMDTMLKSGN